MLGLGPEMGLHTCLGWKQEGRKKKKGKRKKALCPLWIHHNTPWTHSIQNLPSPRRGGMTCSFPSTPPHSSPQSPSCPLWHSLPCGHFFLAIWEPTAIPDNYPSHGRNRNQIAPKINAVGGRARGSATWFDLCQPHPPRMGIAPEGYISLPSGSFPGFF